MTGGTPEEWGAIYREARPDYEAFCAKLSPLVENLIQQEGIELVHFECRVKTVESFVEKLQRLGVNVGDDAFAAVVDLVGLRAVTYYLADIEPVAMVLKRELNIDLEKSGEAARGLASDQFGYRSAHYIGRLKELRASLPEWHAFKDFNVEIQVRTVPQHAWACVSHKIDYKSAQEAPEALRRRLSRLSALLELADEQVTMLKEERELADAQYTEQVRQGNLDVPIDTSSLQAYMSITGQHRTVRDLLVEHGFKTEDLDEDVAQALPRDRADLVSVLLQNDMTSLDDVDAYLADTARLAWLMAALRDEYAEDDRSGSVDDLLTRMLLVDPRRSSRPGSDIYHESTFETLMRIRETLPDDPP